MATVTRFAEYGAPEYVVKTFSLTRTVMIVLSPEVCIETICWAQAATGRSAMTLSKRIFVRV